MKTNLRFRPCLALVVIEALLAIFFSAAPALADGGAVMTVTPGYLRFFCGESMDVVFGYTPDQVGTPVLRGYSVRIAAPHGLTFDESDILVNSPLHWVNDTHQIIRNGEADFTIDFTFLDQDVGLSEEADLFVITYHDLGYNIPGTVGIESGRFRTPENQDIVVDVSARAALSVVCVAPLPPTLDPEPEFTPGTTNTLGWSDESDVGAVAYDVLMSTDAAFSVITDESGWIPGLAYQFTGLSDGQEYFFKVLARNFTEKVSQDSNVESTVQDAVPPQTGPDPLDPVQYLTDFGISFQFAETGSGFDHLELFYRHDGGPWTDYGTFAASPVDFTAGDGDGLYEFHTIGTDLAGNVEAVPTGPQASTTLDTSEPYGSFTINAGVPATNNPDVTLVISVIRADQMRFSNDGINWPSGWTPLANVYAWTIPATEEIHTVYGEFRDSAQQVLQASDDIEFDITPPGGITSPAAWPTHLAVLLSWTNPTDPDFHQVEIWRGLLHDGAHNSTYPSYAAGTIPAAPADHAAAMASAEWEMAGLSGIGATSFIDSVAARGIYYYEFFAADPAYNYSVPSGVLPRATNYILGDVAQPRDGLVRAADITVLGTTFGVTGSSPLFLGEADVGPTTDGTGAGIPQPDSIIDFEDEMIFGMNYTPSAKNLADPRKLPGSCGPVSLDWRPAGDRSWTLELVAPCPCLKGVSLSADLSGAGTPVVTAGTAVTAGDDPFSLRVMKGPGLETSLVVLGTGRGLSVVGDLLTVEFPAAATVPVPTNITLDLRDTGNRPLEYDLQGKSAGLPSAAFFLGEARPNPFNPSTTIRFGIPEKMPVRLEIYGMDGRRVATLVDKVMGAGLHEAVWLGRDDSGRQSASGVYFAKLLAGSSSRVRKLTLMK